MASSLAVASAPSSVLVTGSSLLARQLRREHDLRQAAHGLEVWEPPAIYSLDGWMRLLWTECAVNVPTSTPVLLNSAQTHALWTQIISSYIGSYAGGESGVLLDLNATASAAARAWDLYQAWELPNNAEIWAVSEDSQAFSQWAAAITSELRSRNWITSAELPRELAARIEAGKLLLSQQVRLQGINQVSPVTARFLAACHAQTDDPPPVAPAKIQRADCDDATDELIRAAHWARAQLEQNPQARIGILVCNLAPLAHAAARIFDDVLQPGLSFAPANRAPAFSIALGPSLSDVPILRTALAVLGLLTGIHRSEAVALWSTSYLKATREHLSRVESRLRSQSRDVLSWDLPELQPLMPEFAADAGQLPRRLLPSAWAAEFSRLLKKAGWPGHRPLTTSEKDALDQWGDVLSNFASLDLMYSKVPLYQALEQLRRIARRSRFAQDATPVPVEIMDLSDAHGLSFDGVWVAGLHDGAFPAPPRPNPFLPLSLQTARRVPHSSAEWELEYAQNMMERIARSAPIVIASYPKAAGEEELRPSPLLEKRKKFALFATPQNLPELIAETSHLEEINDAQAPPSTNTGLQQGGAKVLQNQAACPFKAFATHRLGARSLDEGELGVSPRDHGNLAHQVMEHIWGQLHSQAELIALPDMEQFVADCIHDVLEAHTQKRSGTAPWFLAVERQRLQRVIETWLKYERVREPFTVVSFEQQKTMEIGGLRIEIRPDRVDQYESGQHAVIDYKTSKQIKGGIWDGERPDEPQLPLYALKLVEDGSKVGEIMLARLATGITEQQKIRINQNGGELEYNLTVWPVTLRNLAESFARGDAAVAPKVTGKTCEYCELKPVCRIEVAKLEEDTNG